MCKLHYGGEHGKKADEHGKWYNEKFGYIMFNIKAAALFVTHNTGDINVEMFAGIEFLMYSCGHQLVVRPGE